MRRIDRWIVTLCIAVALPFSALMAALATASADGSLTATFSLASDWGSGYQASYTITNNTATPIAGWTVAFDLPAGQQMGDYWNALETSSGSHQAFTDRNYNSDIAPDGGTASFGFIVSYSDGFAAPTNCTVNGSPCAGGATASPAVNGTRQPTAATVNVAVPSSGRAGGSLPVAPYVDMTNSQEGLLDQAATGAGLKAFTAAFVTGSACTPIWGDTLPVTSDQAVTDEITRAESEGVTPIVSFGGEAGVELASSCTNLSQLVAAYQSVINALQVTHIDFDIEGGEIAYKAVNDLRFRAINALEAANPGLVVSLTIPVEPTGPDRYGQALLQQAHADGTRIGLVNTMAMDYYGTADSGGTDMGALAIKAAQSTLSFLQSVFPGATYSMIGVTPMLGQNDDPAEVFSEADARTLVGFAEQNHLGRLAFWSVDRDQPCAGSASGLPQCSQISQQPLDFTQIFERYTG